MSDGKVHSPIYAYFARWWPRPSSESCPHRNRCKGTFQTPLRPESRHDGRGDSRVGSGSVTLVSVLGPVPRVVKEYRQPHVVGTDRQ